MGKVANELEAEVLHELWSKLLKGVSLGDHYRGAL